MNQVLFLIVKVIETENVSCFLWPKMDIIRKKDASVENEVLNLDEEQVP